jgi:cytochrome c553
MSLGRWSVLIPIGTLFLVCMPAMGQSQPKNLPHDTTNDFIVGGVAQTLDDESIQAIAAWLSSLTPAGSTL